MNRVKSSVCKIIEEYKTIEKMDLIMNRINKLADAYDPQNPIIEFEKMLCNDNAIMDKTDLECDNDANCKRKRPQSMEDEAVEKKVNTGEVQVPKKRRDRRKPPSSAKVQQKQPNAVVAVTDAVAAVKEEAKEDVDFQKFIKILGETWSTATNENNAGRHDAFINFAWKVYSDSYTKAFGKSITSFDAFTDLFYIRADDLMKKDIFVIGMSEYSFNARTGMNLCVVRRLLYEIDVVLLNVPLENIYHEYFINKVVVPYLYFANVNHGNFIQVCVAEEIIQKPDIFSCQCIPFDKIFEKIKNVF